MIDKIIYMFLNLQESCINFKLTYTFLYISMEFIFYLNYKFVPC